MQHQSQHVLSDDERRSQRALILQLLRDDHDLLWMRAELERELSDVVPLQLNHAIEDLGVEGVAKVTGELVCASRAALRIDALGLIAV